MIQTAMFSWDWKGHMGGWLSPFPTVPYVAENAAQRHRGLQPHGTEAQQAGRPKPLRAAPVSCGTTLLLMPFRHLTEVKFNQFKPAISSQRRNWSSVTCESQENQLFVG